MNITKWKVSVKDSHAQNITGKEVPKRRTVSTIQSNIPVVRLDNNCSVPVIDARSLSEEEWIMERVNSVGGSTVGDILSPDKYGTALTAFMKFSGEYREDLSDNPAIKRGNRLEDPIIVWFQEEFERISGKHIDVFKSPFIYQNIERSYQKMNIDGLAWIDEFKLPDGNVVQGWCLLEVKTAGSYMKKKWKSEDCLINDPSGELPDRYYYQIQYYLSGLGLDWCFLPVWFDGDILWRIIPRNEEVCKIMYEKLDQFIDDCNSGQIPEPYGYEIESKFIDYAIRDGKLNNEEIEDSDISTALSILDENRTELKKYKNTIEPKLSEHERLVDKMELKIKLLLGKMGKNKVSIDGTDIEILSNGKIKIRRRSSYGKR